MYFWLGCNYVVCLVVMYQCVGFGCVGVVVDQCCVLCLMCLQYCYFMGVWIGCLWFSQGVVGVGLDYDQVQFV